MDLLNSVNTSIIRTWCCMHCKCVYILFYKKMFYIEKLNIFVLLNVM